MAAAPRGPPCAQRCPRCQRGCDVRGRGVPTAPRLQPSPDGAAREGGQGQEGPGELGRGRHIVGAQHRRGWQRLRMASGRWASEKGTTRGQIKASVGCFGLIGLCLDSFGCSLGCVWAYWVAFGFIWFYSDYLCPEAVPVALSRCPQCRPRPRPAATAAAPRPRPGQRRRGAPCPEQPWRPGRLRLRCPHSRWRRATSPDGGAPAPWQRLPSR